MGDRLGTQGAVGIFAFFYLYTNCPHFSN